MDLEEYRKKLEKRAEENRKAFEGEYKKEIEALLGLSREEIDRITPDTTDLQTYDQLITIVKEASSNNISQAELKNNIMQLGSIGIEIAKRISGLSTLFT